jgi:hypothetical protein
MLSTSRAESSPRLEESVAELLRAQSADGSWPARPMLRLSDRTCATPWAKASAGELFADGRSLFTTATVLHCLQPILPAGAPDHAFDLGLS